MVSVASVAFSSCGKLDIITVSESDTFDSSVTASDVPASSSLIPLPDIG